MSKLIYIADDEKNIRDIIEGFLIKEGFDTCCFETGDDLLSTFYDKPCDLVVLDIMMPGKSGLEVCTALRQKNNVPIIMVSARDSELDKITGLSIGSDDYLTKPFSPMELVLRVKSMFRRIDIERGAQNNECISFKDLKLDASLRSCTFNDINIMLTPMEYELLFYMFNNSNKAIRREELLKNVWKFEDTVDTRAVDDVVKRLRKKIEKTNVKISTVWGYGFKLEDTER